MAIGASIRRIHEENVVEIMSLSLERVSSAGEAMAKLLKAQSKM